MKRLLLLLLLILLGLVAVVVGRTLLLPAAAFNSAPASQLTASNAAFAGMRDWLAQRYPQVTANTEPLATGSPSILLRWPGKDAELTAALLMAHKDVVPVAPGTEAL